MWLKIPVEEDGNTMLFLCLCSSPRRAHPSPTCNSLCSNAVISREMVLPVPRSHFCRSFQGSKGSAAYSCNFPVTGLVTEPCCKTTLLYQLDRWVFGHSDWSSSFRKICFLPCSLHISRRQKGQHWLLKGRRRHSAAWCEPTAQTLVCCLREKAAGQTGSSHRPHILLS